MQNFNKRLEEVRNNLKLKKGEMAKLCGVANSTYTKYESGDRLPDANFLSAIAAEGIDVNYILTGIKYATVAHLKKNAHIHGDELQAAEDTAGYELSKPLSEREKALLEYYRAISDREDQGLIERMALLAAGLIADNKETETQKSIGKFIERRIGKTDRRIAKTDRRKAVK